uniref:Uncharacterized protein n=2 Tax=Amphimedon queenslandica TaxID=400682 RepID=A0A1X7SJN9_AMPQE
GAFRDAVCIRYGWRPPDLPSSCVCGHAFSVDHALSCTYGGFHTLRHNNVRDLLVSLLKDVCPNVCREPSLQPLSGERLFHRSACTEDGARLDIAVEEFWGYQGRRSFFDVRVFNPLTPTYRGQSLASCYKRNEEDKKRKYDERVREVEHGCFAPLVFSAAGGFAPIAGAFIKRLALLHAERLGKQYNTLLYFLRCEISFSLIKSTIRCLRGSRSSYSSPPSQPCLEDMSRIISDARLSI